ncbi:uncharacterized protein LOC62_01G001054 [Vanrija pseudolonga]|uniref:Uncharacterized protein n=1 Tax=Vanrija pseudolonga TaxID=143232 RepID=A0AAF1BHF0_9TREE|nr:hypothetical protein LOC62_01G001054 [Vanrija pseudolonga]
MAAATPTGAGGRTTTVTSTLADKPTPTTAKHTLIQTTFSGSSSYDVRNGVWVPVAPRPKKTLSDGTLIGVIVACIVGGLIILMILVPFVKKLHRRRQSRKARKDAEALLNAPSPSFDSWSFDAEREKVAAPPNLSPTVGARSRAESFNTLQHVAPRRQPSSSMLSTHSRSSSNGASPSPPLPGKTYAYVDRTNGLLTPEVPKLNLNLAPGQMLSPDDMDRVKRVSAQSAVSAYSTASTLSPPPRFQDNSQPTRDSLGYQYGSEDTTDFHSDETHSDERPFAYDTSPRSTLASHEPTVIRPVVEAKYSPAQYASRENDPANPFANPPRFIQPGEGGRRSLTAPAPASARPVSVGKAF